MTIGCRPLLWCAALIGIGACRPAPESPAATARNQPGTGMGLYVPEQHANYDGRFEISAGQVYQVGSLTDASPWDHLGDDASSARAVDGTIHFAVNEVTNTGEFRAVLQLPEGEYVVTMDSVHEFSPCQDGGIAAFLYEHGDAGCGDANWPKSLLYIAGWGFGTGTLNGDTLYAAYQLHFMVTQGMRDRTTFRVYDIGPTGDSRAGMVNPAQQQLDFYIRSPAENSANRPAREVFDHFFAMEVTWR